MYFSLPSYVSYLYDPYTQGERARVHGDYGRLDGSQTMHPTTTTKKRRLQAYLEIR